MDFSDVLQLATRPRNVAFVLIGSFIFYALYRVILYPRFFSPLRFVPGPPIDGVILGHFYDIIHSEGGAIQGEWTKKYGPAVRAVGPVGRERLILLKPEVLHKILVTDWVDYPRPKFMRNILGLSAGYGLLTVTGNEHRQMRKAMNPAFALPNLMAQTDSYFDSIETLVKILRSQIARNTTLSHGMILPVYEWMSKVTLDIICDTAFGYHSNSLLNPNNELTEAYEDLISLQSGVNLAVLSSLVAIPGMPAFLASEMGYRYRHVFACLKLLAPVKTFIGSLHQIRRISREMLREKLADTAVDAADMATKKDIMSLLVRARKGETKGYQLSDEALVDQVLTFLGAGHETTASGLSWTLWLLANDPRAQSKLRDEVSPIFAVNGRPDYRVLKDLKMLDCVIMESLRLLPPVPMTLREAGKSDWIDGVYVPKGTLFHIPLRAINTWPEVWGPDAEHFRPERWLDLPEKYNSTFSMMSFITGPHACIGKTMSISEMKAVLAAMITNFEFAPAYAGQVAKPTSAITMKPDDNMPLLVTPIHKLVV
ncbi:cytochrome P450 [Artomyces pyxidatus]|uniref:Cytochrome P450 n=1 Tax=Artomyces pyxidatus TaxID=48021 RepID=A0ACB8SK97_9AGAM|nr:cytochrome P450 [Artomyces pyxidatus]